MVKIKVFGEPNLLMKRAGTKETFFRFDEKGEHVFFEGSYGKAQETRLLNRYNHTKEEVEVIPLKDFNEFMQFKGEEESKVVSLKEYNQMKMQIVTLKGRLTKLSNKLKEKEDEKV